MKKALEEKEGGGLDIDSLIKWKLMDRMFSNPENSGVQAMQNQLQQMRQELQQEKLLSQQQLQNERVIQKLEQMRGQQGLTAQDAITFMADKQTAIGQKDIELQRLRDERLKEIREEMDEVKQSGGALGPKRLKELREEIAGIKEMSHELGEREKGAGEYISETIGNVANTLQPAITRLIEQKERQREMQMQMQQPQFQLPRNPEPEPVEAQPPEPQYQTDMTETEKQMADQMEQMYIKKEEK